MAAEPTESSLWRDFRQLDPGPRLSWHLCILALASFIQSLERRDPRALISWCLGAFVLDLGKLQRMPIDGGPAACYNALSSEARNAAVCGVAPTPSPQMLPSRHSFQAGGNPDPTGLVSYCEATCFPTCLFAARRAMSSIYFGAVSGGHRTRNALHMDDVIFEQCSRPVRTLLNTGDGDIKGSAEQEAFTERARWPPLLHSPCPQRWARQRWPSARSSSRRTTCQARVAPAPNSQWRYQRHVYDPRHTFLPRR